MGDPSKMKFRKVVDPSYFLLKLLFGGYLSTNVLSKSSLNTSLIRISRYDWKINHLCPTFILGKVQFFSTECSLKFHYQKTEMCQKQFLIKLPISKGAL